MFARDVGLPFSVDVPRVRLIRAIEYPGTASPSTDAAHAAGFSDSSHAIKALREMFGIRPRRRVPESTCSNQEASCSPRVISVRRPSFRPCRSSWFAFGRMDR
ncbi:AraC family transcriptional regulator (plasmid) [Mycolicibacterium frederiksbergense]|uniref:AraC family transcriptional regulator n=1 Tax=Mycolicibacterium frederiksbergense TaxID=117567 RepID=A0A6H0S180_9MYCO|nr:AraC family transcriptional regulator [Mycolicibacterium frederiksbergense]